jgi:hypothetical protein
LMDIEHLIRPGEHVLSIARDHSFGVEGWINRV